MHNYYIFFIKKNKQIIRITFRFLLFKSHIVDEPGEKRQDITPITKNFRRTLALHTNENDIWAQYYIMFLFQYTNASGMFELQVLEMANPRGELSNGECCGEGARSPVTNRCSVACQTFFRLCLKEYQSNVSSTGSCSFGNSSSQVLGRDSFTLADPDRGKLVLPFTFRWTVSFYFDIEFPLHEKSLGPPQVSFAWKVKILKILLNQLKGIRNWKRNE